MATAGLARPWADVFFRLMQTHDVAAGLKEAALSASLGVWTERLTSLIVATCEALGWRPAAKGHLGDVLPLVRQEYLALDVMAFLIGGTTRWPFPIAVFELENSREDDRVAYSLWKVLCIHVSLRVVFAYHRDTREGLTLVNRLTESVIGGMLIAERMALTGETSLIIGGRGEADTFPYGYFKIWILNANTGRFERL
jgi:hypothetical protein